MDGRKVSIRRIIGNVIGNLRIKNVNEYIDDFARWAVEAENFIGTSNSYVDKECLIQFKNMKACLPDDLMQLTALKFNDREIELTERNFSMWDKGPSNGGSVHLATVQAARLNLGVTAQVKTTLGSHYGAQHDFVNNIVFSLKNRYVYVNTTGIDEVGISYSGIALDNEGWPMIAEGHEPAVQAYLAWQYSFSKAFQGKLNVGISDRMERRWYDLCAQARGDDELPNPAELEYLGNMMNQLMPLPNKKFF